MTLNNIEKDFSFNIQVLERTNGPANITTYDLVRCSETNVFKENINNVKNYLVPSADSYFCLSDNVNISDLKGKYGSQNGVDYIIQMIYCKEKDICNPIDQIKQKFKQFFYNIIISDNYIDSNDYENPVKSTYSSYLLLASTINPRRDTIYLKRVDYISDNGSILEDINEYKGYIVDGFQTEIIYNPDANEIARTIITHQLKNLIIKRQYVKIQTVAANIGGFLKLCTTLSMIISKYYSYFEFYISLHI